MLAQPPSACGEPDAPGVVCDVCRALPKPQQKRLRNRAMTRMLRASLRAQRATHAT
jgi:hypothetical protein